MVAVSSPLGVGFLLVVSGFDRLVRRRVPVSCFPSRPLRGSPFLRALRARSASDSGSDDATSSSTTRAVRVVAKPTPRAADFLVRGRGEHASSFFLTRSHGAPIIAQDCERVPPSENTIKHMRHLTITSSTSRSRAGRRLLIIVPFR